MPQNQAEPSLVFPRKYTHVCMITILTHCQGRQEECYNKEPNISERHSCHSTQDTNKITSTEALYNVFRVYNTRVESIRGLIDVASYIYYGFNASKAKPLTKYAF
jgi:hypothetical protein